jgi:hypothetical protein
MLKQQATDSVCLYLEDRAYSICDCLAAEGLEVGSSVRSAADTRAERMSEASRTDDSLAVEGEPSKSLAGPRSLDVI